MKLYVCFLGLLVAVFVENASTANSFKGRFNYYGPRTRFVNGLSSRGSVGNFRTRRQLSPQLSGLQSPTVRLSRFSGFNMRSRVSPLRGLTQRNPFASRQFNGLRSSSLLRSHISPRSNPSRIIQRGRSSRRLRNPSRALFSTRGGLRSFGTGVDWSRRLRSQSRGQRMSTYFQQLRQRGYTGTGTRDDPIRIRATSQHSRRSSTRQMRPSSRSRASGGRMPTHRVNPSTGKGIDQGVIALFGFDNPTDGIVLPKLSETIDKSVSIKRTPIKKTKTKTSSIGAVKTSKQATVKKTEGTVHDEATTIKKSNKEVTELVGLPKKIEAELTAKIVSEPKAEIKPGMPVEIASGVPSNKVADKIAAVSENIPSKAVSRVLNEVVAEVPSDAVLETPVDFVAETNIVAEVPVEAVVAETATKVVAEVPLETALGTATEIVADVPVEAVVEGIATKIVAEVPVEAVVAETATKIVAEVPVETALGTATDIVADVPVEAVVEGIETKIVAEVPVEAVVAETATKIVAEVPVETALGTATEIVADVPVEAVVEGIATKIVAEVPVEAVVADIAAEVVAEVPAEVLVDPAIKVVPEIQADIQSRTPTEVALGTANNVVVDTAVTDADAVNININANITSDTTKTTETVKPIVPETILPTDIGTTLNLVEPVAVFVEGHAVSDPHHISSTKEQIVSKQPSELGHLDTALVEAAVLGKHDVGGISVIAESNKSLHGTAAASQEVGKVAETIATDTGGNIPLLTNTAIENTNSNSVDGNNSNAL